MTEGLRRFKSSWFLKFISMTSCPDRDQTTGNAEGRSIYGLEGFQKSEAGFEAIHNKDYAILASVLRRPPFMETTVSPNQGSLHAHMLSVLIMIRINTRPESLKPET